MKNPLNIAKIVIESYLGYVYYVLFKSQRKFKFKETKLKYFYHPCNSTWRNERAVEIPIIKKYLKRIKAKPNSKILEVGNVLSHYFKVDHDIIDKYEKRKKVINKDIIDFYPEDKYDLIITISTLEHVGWDETPKEPKKVLKAIKTLKSYLNKKGLLIVTVPLGYNKEMDNMIKTKEISFDQQFYLKRVSKDNRWIETDFKNVENAKYNKPFRLGNALMIGISINQK